MEEKRCPDCGYLPWERSNPGYWNKMLNQDDGCDEIAAPVVKNQNVKNSVKVFDGCSSQIPFAALNCNLTQESISNIVEQVVKNISAQNNMLNELIDSLYGEIAELQNEISILKQEKE